MQNPQQQNVTEQAGDVAKDKEASPAVSSSQAVSPSALLHESIAQKRNAEAATASNKHWLEYATSFFALIAALAAIAAASFGFWQAWVANDTEVRQLRAYVHITPGKFSGTGSLNGPLDIALQPGIKVFGQTPAGQVVVPWALDVNQWPMTDNFQFAYMKSEMQSTSSQAPGEERPIDAKTRTISREEMAAIAAGTKRLYAYGTIVYRDVFGVSRYTHFCWHFDVEGITKQNANDCPIHNGADWGGTKDKTGVVIPMK